MKYQKINGHDFYNMVVNASNRLLEESDFVNALNVFPVPDGDTGTNMSMTFKAAVKEIENLNSESIGETSKILAKGALMGARGNSGVILSQILRGISKGLEGKTEVDGKELAVAFEEGSKAAYKAVMRPTEGTILSVIRAAAESVTNVEERNIIAVMETVVTNAKIMLDKTPDLLPALKKAKVVDSGGMGLYIILQGMLDALKNDIKAEIKDVAVKSAGATGAASTEDVDIKFGYCTEFIILGDAAKSKEFQDKIESLGDSMIVVGYEDVIKVHIHTNDPGKVLSNAVQYGELSKIKIDNMREEHREVLALKNEEAASDVQKEVAPAESKKYAFISVAMGDGITRVLKDLGVDYVIEGGQTMNPSTQDMMECISKLNADHIFILPNNKNIIMAAEQAAEISDKDVRVIPTKSIPQGITAITMFNYEADVDANEEALKEALEMVKTGSVTYAVRDTEMDGIEIKEGNMLGLVESKIKTILFMSQFYLSFGDGNSGFVLLPTCESSGNSHFSDNHRRNLRTVYGNIGIEETQSVDRAEIDEPVMIFGNASADETSLWDVVGVIVGIETFFRGDIATDTGIGTCPDVAVLIFTDSSYVCIGQSFFSLKDLIVKITGRRKTYLTGGKPHLAFTAPVYLINRIGTKTFVLVELPDQLHIRRIYPDSSSESSYPETSFTVLGNAAYKIFQQLAVGGVIMMNHLLAGKVYNEHPCVSSYPYLFILVFIEDAYVEKLILFQFDDLKLLQSCIVIADVAQIGAEP